MKILCMLWLRVKRLMRLREGPYETVLIQYHYHPCFKSTFLEMSPSWKTFFFFLNLFVIVVVVFVSFKCTHWLTRHRNGTSCTFNGTDRKCYFLHIVLLELIEVCFVTLLSLEKPVPHYQYCIHTWIHYQYCNWMHTWIHKWILH